MTRSQIKKQIKKKYRTYSRFAQLAGLDYYRFKKDFLDDATAKKGQHWGHIEALLRSIESNDAFTPELRKSLQDAINAFGGVRMFCFANPRFVVSSVFQILSGDFEYYQRITPTIKALLEHFDIKH